MRSRLFIVIGTLTVLFLVVSPALTQPRPGGGGRVLEEVQATAHAMKANGFMVLDSLWTVNGENAAQCDSDCGRDYRAA